MTAHPPQDAEAVARAGVWSALEDWQNTTRTAAQVHRDVDAALTAYAAAIEARVRVEEARKREDAESCLAMVRSLLVDSLGEEAMSKTPPMMYDDAIRRVWFLARTLEAPK